MLLNPKYGTWPLLSYLFLENICNYGKIDKREYGLS